MVPAADKIGDKKIVVWDNPENIFVQSNEFIQARYKDAISFWEMMIFGKMCTMIDPKDDDFHEYKIYVKDLINFAGLEKNGRLYDTVIEAANKLRHREIIVAVGSENGKERVLETYLVTGVERPTHNDGSENVYIALTIHPKLKPFLLQLKRDFTKIDITNYKFLHSGTITRLYQLLKSHHDRGRKNPKFDLTELKEMLGISTKYDLYANFRIKVLDESQKRFEGTDMRFTYSEIKQGKKVVGIHFFTTSEKHQKAIDITPPSVKLDYNGVGEGLFTELFPLVEHYGVADNVFASLLKLHKEEDIRKAIRLTDKTVKAGKIKDSAAGFFVQAVKAGYTDLDEMKANKKAATKQSAPKIEEKPAVSSKSALQKQLFEEERLETLALLQREPQLEEQILDKIRHSIFRDIYESDKSFTENLQKPSFFAAVLNIVKGLKNG
jgi:hypothetical protein